MKMKINELLENSKIKFKGFLKIDKKRYAFEWSIILAIGIIIMSLFFVFGNFSLNFTLVLLLMALKFIAGFGIILSIISFSLKYLEKSMDRFKGKDKIGKIKKYNKQMLIIPILLLLYKGPYKFIKSWAANGGNIDTYFDEFLFIYGVFNLIIKSYLVPLFHKRFLPNDGEITFKDKFQDKKKNVVKGFKTRYYKITKNYAKMTINEQTTIKDVIDEWKQKFAVYALLVIGIGTLIITPVSLIFIIIWLRVFVLNDKKLYNFERYFLMVGHIMIMVIAVVIPFVPRLVPDFYEPITKFSYLVDLSAFLGLLLGSWMYMKQLRSSSYTDWLTKKEEKYERKKLKKELKKPSTSIKEKKLKK